MYFVKEGVDLKEFEKFGFVKHDSPLVTIEYGLKQNKVLQIFGYDDTIPEDSVLTFVNNIWLKYCKKVLKQVV